jgi:curli production assembly/transport component CsgG
VEREGLQNLLTERKIIRAYLEKQGGNLDKDLPPLDMASILMEGGIIG